MVHLSHPIADPSGLHARPIAAIASVLSSYESTVRMACAGRTCDAQDLLGMLALEARAGDVLEVTVEGPDEEQAAAALRAVLP